jgi:hypothetical protein
MMETTIFGSSVFEKLKAIPKIAVMFTAVHFGDEALSKSQEYEWCTAFRDSHEIMSNLPNFHKHKSCEQ